ncbi:MAG: SDR family NAD(P)-dependent oxidoreductase, partial [bacterium]
RVLVTGASSGLGAALAREHARQGHALLLLARRAEKLKSLAEDCAGLGSPCVLVRAGDVGLKANLMAAVRTAQDAWGGLDLAYANAGYSQSGRLEDLSLAQWRRQMRVNVEGVLFTAQACGPLLKSARGCFAVVGSVSGYGSTSETGAYAASKAAVRALTQILDLEWAEAGVGVTHIVPGFFASEIRLKDSDGRPSLDKMEYIPDFILGKTEALAKAVRRAVEARRRELIWPKHAKVAVFLMRHLPSLSHALNLRISLLRTKQRRKIQGR